VYNKTYSKAGYTEKQEKILNCKSLTAVFMQPHEFWCFMQPSFHSR